jgi:hypothetical protein
MNKLDKKVLGLTLNSNPGATQCFVYVDGKLKPDWPRELRTHVMYVTDIMHPLRIATTVHLHTLCSPTGSTE